MTKMPRSPNCEEAKEVECGGGGWIRVPSDAELFALHPVKNKNCTYFRLCGPIFKISRMAIPVNLWDLIFRWFPPFSFPLAKPKMTTESHTIQTMISGILWGMSKRICPAGAISVNAKKKHQTKITYLHRAGRLLYEWVELTFAILSWRLDNVSFAMNMILKTERQDKELWHEHSWCAPNWAKKAPNMQQKYNIFCFVGILNLDDCSPRTLRL